MSNGGSALKTSPYQAVTTNIFNPDRTTPLYSNGMYSFLGFAKIISPTQTATPAGNETIDCNYKHIGLKTGGTATITLSNLSEGQTFNLVMSTTGSAYTVTWSPTIVWPAGKVPVPSVTVGRYDVYTFLKVGGVIFGNCLKDMY
jgi:hypothetical protein